MPAPLNQGMVRHAINPVGSMTVKLVLLIILLLILSLVFLLAFYVPAFFKNWQGKKSPNPEVSETTRNR